MKVAAARLLPPLNRVYKHTLTLLQQLVNPQATVTSEVVCRKGDQNMKHIAILLLGTLLAGFANRVTSHVIHLETRKVPCRDCQGSASGSGVSPPSSGSGVSPPSSGSGPPSSGSGPPSSGSGIDPPLCRFAPAIANGRVSVWFQVAFYKCNPGYKMKGIGVSICVKGRWTSRLPMCLSKGDVLCPVLPRIANGIVYVPNRKVQSLAYYSCSPKYTLSGEPWRTCKSDGTWSGAEPTCTAKSIKASNKYCIHLPFWGYLPGC